MALTRRIRLANPSSGPFAVAGVLALACGGDFTARADGDAGPGSGGAVGESGGATNGGRGGRTGSGGTGSSGSVAVSGGTTGAGGVIVQGGSTGTGGRLGAGGRSEAGGNVGTGGFVGAGGAMGSGGSIGAGGLNASGGSPGASGAATGGSLGAGGSGMQCSPGDVECDDPAGPRRCGPNGTWQDTQCGPLLATDVTDVDVSPLPGFALSSGFRCKALSVCGVAQNCVYYSEFLGSRQSGDDPTYSDGAELADAQAVQVRIDGGAASQCGNPPITLVAGEGIAVALGDGRRVHVVFPDFTGGSLTLYVREDGATFYDAALSQRAR